MANGKWDCCEVSRARPNQMHDELLRDDPKVNLGRKHASGGMLFHFRSIGATARHKEIRAITRVYVFSTLSSKLSQSVPYMKWYSLNPGSYVPGNEILRKYLDSASSRIGHW